MPRGRKRSASDAPEDEAEAKRRALEAAEAEGLQLERTDGSGGFKQEREP